MLSKLCVWYLKLLEATSRIEVSGFETLRGKFLAGFWHGDSLAMNLLLKKAAMEGMDVCAVVTADERGNCIEKTISSCGGKTFRLTYGQGEGLRASRQLLKCLKDAGTNYATALDGPLGPAHEPKKFLILMAQKSGRSLICVKVEYSRKISVSTRWDNYSIPLPFSTLRFTLYDFGKPPVERDESFTAISSTIREHLLDSPEEHAVNA